MSSINYWPFGGTTCPPHCFGRGAEDALIPLEAGRRINSLLENSTLVILEKCGHVPQEEKPHRVIDEVTKFIVR